MSSTCIGVITGFMLLFALTDNAAFIRNRRVNYFVTGCVIFYILQLIGYFYSHDKSFGILQIEVKITLLFIPLALYYSPYLNNAFRKKLMPYYILLLTLVMLICLGIAMKKYLVGHDSSVYFYYALVSPFGLHAIYVSIFTFVGLVYLLERTRHQSYIINRLFHFFIISCFILFIVLLASKLVIIFSFVSILIYSVLILKKTGSVKEGFAIAVSAGIIMISILMITHNPIRSRFRDIFIGNIDVIEKDQYSPADYFNGIQFRLLQWKLVSEILTEQHAWVAGVSPGDAQDLLDSKYASLHMYTGDRSSKSHGYLRYNTHNQFLESVLQSGLIGLSVFLLICAGLIRMMIENDNTEFRLTCTLVLIYCFLESICQTQYGVLIFTFFPLFLYCTTANDIKKKFTNSPS
jgi:O-antigen ligase